MILKLVYKIRRWCDKYIEKQVAKTWVPHSEDHNDPYCSHCGYMCDHCFRPY